MRALQANQVCEGEGVALGLCLGTYEDELEDVEACAYCPLNAVVDSGLVLRRTWPAFAHSSRVAALPSAIHTVSTNCRR